VENTCILALGSVAALKGVEAHTHHVYECAGSLINSFEGPWETQNPLTMMELIQYLIGH